MSKGTVLVPGTKGSYRAAKDYLLSRGFMVIQGANDDEETLARDIVDCDALVIRGVPVTQKVIDAANKLKIVAKTGSGYEMVDQNALSARNIILTTTPYANSVSVAEHTMFLMLAVARSAHNCETALRKGDFSARYAYPVYELSGKTLGVLGVGRIGSLVAQKAKLGFDMNVVGYGHHMDSSMKNPYVRLVDTQDELLAQSDFVSINIPLNAKTTKSFGLPELKKMKSTAYLINTARGGVIDEEALIEALKTGVIAGAGLDVFTKEPPEPDNLLFRLDNVFVTPHHAGLTKEAMARASVEAAKSIEDVLEGREPKWPIRL